MNSNTWGTVGDYTDWLPHPTEPDAPAAVAVDSPVATALTLTAPVEIVARRARARAVTRRWNELPKAVAVAVPAAVAVGVVGAGLMLAAGGGHRAPTPRPVTAAVSTPARPAGAAAWCPDARSDGHVSGNSTGATDSGPDAILALEHAYYVTRDASAVLGVMAPSAPVGTAQQIQSGIDAVPAGTTHCVVIDAVPDGRWTVAITERRPDGSRVQHHQTVTTSVLDGRTVVARVDGD